MNRLYSLANTDAMEVSVAYLHSDTYSSVSAFDIKENIRIVLRISREVGATEISARIFDEYLRPTGKTVPGVWRNHSFGVDEYLFDFCECDFSPAIRFFDFSVKVFDSELYVKRAGRAYLTRDNASGGLFQFTVSDFLYKRPSKMYGGIIYHIFVDRFRRGGDVPVYDGAVLVGGEWESIPEYPEYPGAPLKNNTFYGGTLYGIVEKLDYIKSLGTTAIYLSPIFSSVSNHKYDTADYMTVDEMFGGDEALSLLLRESEKRNIKIILDGVFNHTGDDSIYFNKYSRFDTVGAYNSKNSPYYSWYDFQNFPDEYTCWWGIPILPRINPDISECGEYIAGKEGVIAKYRDMGVYGFRLDVCDELSDEFIAKIKNTLSASGESMLYGEVWEDASSKVAYGKRKKYYHGCELDGVMNYPVRVGIIDYIVNKNSEKIRYALGEVTSNMPPRIRNTQMNLLGSHDTVRILTALSGKSGEGIANSELSVMHLDSAERALAKKRLMSAYTVLATLPGIPAIFYGDEAGLEGYSDPFNRMPYPWGKEDTELLSHYRSIGAIRKSHKVYREGEFNVLYLTEQLLIFERADGRDTYITAYNNSDKNVTLAFDVRVSELISQKRPKEYRLSANSSAIFKTKKETGFEIISEA
ncbi:MAG: glycoside hydrolase family 13 protein [Clostridia bacterium]|nr:glycoside hydrolase family 13 protein [Clostridia bacterium]